jgi:transposase-like protein
VAALARLRCEGGGFTFDEQVSAAIAAYPWLLAARALYFGGCPRCGSAPGEITDSGGGRKKCPDCGHRFEFFED